MRLYPAIACAFVLVACGSKDGSDSTDDLALNGKSYVVVTGDKLTSTSAELKGTGAIAFSDPVAEDGQDFGISFTLEDGGSLTLTTYGTNNLTGGVSIKFTRAAAKLSASLAAGDGTTDLSAVFGGVDASAAMAFFIDVHNDEDPAHVLAWLQTATDFATPLLNSEEGYASPGKGTGRIWGLTLDQATVTAAVNAAPKLED